MFSKKKKSQQEEPKPSSGQFIKQTVQQKLKIGESNDKYEQEADRVADKVVNNSKGDSVQKKGEEEIQQKPLASEVTPFVQKMESSEEADVQRQEAGAGSGLEEGSVQKMEEEEPVQKQEEEEAVQAKGAVDEEPIQKAEEEEPIQKQEEEEAVQAKDAVEEEPVQKMEEEEPVQAKEAEEEGVQKQEEEEAVQAKRKSTSTSNQPSIETRLNNSKGGGHKLSGKTKNEMEAGFGNDFSNVNIHTDRNAAELSQDMGAKAFAHGNDVYFNKGQYNPESSEGKHLLAHELTHTIQQKGMVQKKVQRHMQSSYPWDGIVSAKYSGALRKVPKQKQGWMADIPKGTRLTVIGNSGNWIQVRVMVGGIQKSGYMSQELVSLVTNDNVSGALDSLQGEEAKWVPSGNTGRNTFATWAKAPSEKDAPPVTAVTTINCWEMILLAAYRTGAITWTYVNSLYLNTTGNWYDELPKRMTSGSTTNFDVSTGLPALSRGDLVFFDGASHVAMATGNGEEIFTFWPPPNTSFTVGGTVDDVKTSTVSALYNYMKANGMGTPTVTFGDPIW